MSIFRKAYISGHGSGLFKQVITTGRTLTYQPPEIVAAFICYKLCRLANQNLDAQRAILKELGDKLSANIYVFISDLLDQGTIFTMDNHGSAIEELYETYINSLSHSNVPASDQEDDDISPEGSFSSSTDEPTTPDAIPAPEALGGCLYLAL